MFFGRLGVFGGGISIRAAAGMGLGISALCVGLRTSPAHGEGVAPDSALAGALAAISGSPLTLEDAVQAALAQATAVREAEAELAAAHGALMREKGDFDPELFASFDKSVTETPSASPFAGASVLESDVRTTAAGARVRSPIGTEVSATIETRRQESNSSFSLLVPQYDTQGRLEVTQPLLQGFGPAARSARVAAEREVEAAAARYENAQLAARARAEVLYWDLYAAERDLAVERLVRDRARSFLEQAEMRARAGLVGPNQVANAEFFLAQEELALLDREEHLNAVSDRLSSLLGQRPPAGLVRYGPTSEPPSEFRLAAEDSVVSWALRYNHDLVSMRRRLDAASALANGAAWEALPQLDLVGSLGGNGLGGRGRQVVFGTDTLHTDITGGFGDTWSQVFQRDFPTWSAGLRLTLPLGTRAGRGQRDRLRAEVRRGEQQLEAVRRQLDEDVRGRYRELANARARRSAAARGVAASSEQVRIGVLEYQSGRTTAFELVRLGADLAAAQQRYSQALVRGAQSAAELRRLTAGRFPAGE